MSPQVRLIAGRKERKRNRVGRRRRHQREVCYGEGRVLSVVRSLDPLERRCGVMYVGVAVEATAGAAPPSVSRDFFVETRSVGRQLFSRSLDSVAAGMRHNYMYCAVAVASS